MLLPTFEPRAVLAAIQEHRVTDVMLVPSMLHMVLAATRTESQDAPDTTTLRKIYYGAAPMPPSLLAEALECFPDVGFVQGYGMSETALTVMLGPEFYTQQGRKLGKTGSIGLALPQVEVAIRDTDGVEVNRGTVGELTVKSPSVMLGYHGRPAETAAIIRGGWLYSGDGAYMDDDGFIYLVDRLKDMIISGGENVYSLEVESVLMLHPAVAMAAVIGVPDEKWGERVHAVLTLVDNVDQAELRMHCREHLSAYKVPRGFSLVDALPLSPAGKVLKVELRSQFGSLA